MRIVDLALADHDDDGPPAFGRARQNLARKRRHHRVNLDQIVAQHAADPLIAHVEPRGSAAASSFRLTLRTCSAVDTSKAKPSRCFLFCKGSRARSSPQIAAATVTIPP